MLMFCNSLGPIYAPPFRVVNCEYNGNKLESMKAPAIPMTMALSIGILNIGAIENIAMPAPKLARDLWSFNTGTESIKELIFGIKNGATTDALITAMIASFFKTPFALLATALG